MESPPTPLRRWPAWVAAMSSAMAVAYPIAGWPVLGALVLAAAQLVVLRPWIRSPWGWLALGTAGWTGAALGAPIATIGLPPFVTTLTAACIASVVGGGILGVMQLPCIARDWRGAFEWLAASVLAGPALVAGIWLADAWTLGNVGSGALGGLGYGVVSGLGLAALRGRRSGIGSEAPVAAG